MEQFQTVLGQSASCEISSRNNYRNNICCQLIEPEQQVHNKSTFVSFRTSWQSFSIQTKPGEQLFKLAFLSSSVKAFMQPIAKISILLLLLRKYADSKTYWFTFYSFRNLLAHGNRLYICSFFFSHFHSCMTEMWFMYIVYVIKPKSSGITPLKLLMLPQGWIWTNARDLTLWNSTILWKKYCVHMLLEINFT